MEGASANPTTIGRRARAPRVKRMLPFSYLCAIRKYLVLHIALQEHIAVAPRVAPCSLAGFP